MRKSPYERSETASVATETEKYQVPKPSNELLLGSICAFIGGLLLLMSFASPYWLVSWHDTHSPFQRMGLWEFCFDRFRYPLYQFDKLFTGCYYVFSEEYRIVREWLLPGWLMAVQAFVTLALMASFLAQILTALSLTRWPLSLVLRYEWFLSGVAAFSTAFAGFFVFLAVSVFGGQCWRRDWLLYPNFNHLSWSYAFAVLSFFINFAAAACLALDMRKAWDRKQESRNLVMQMQQTNGAGSTHMFQAHPYI